MTPTRRDFFRAASALSVGGVISPSLLADRLARIADPLSDGASGHVAVARGYVFLDRQGTGRRSRGNPGIRGVLVSNGVDVVTTDGNGYYQIPVDAESADIFVCKPRDYSIPVDELKRPRFHYFHRRSGTPDATFRYRGIPATGELPPSIDFPLYERPEPDRFKVVMVADPQPYIMEEVDWYGHQTVTELAGVDAAFAIALGDLVGDNLDLFEPLAQVQALTGFPWYSVVGNHDLEFMSPDNRNATEAFRRAWGPTDYAFQYGPVHFLMLNNVWWDGHAGMRDDGHPVAGNYRGHLCDDQIRFVRNYVQHVPEHERLVVCAHMPMVNRGWPLDGGDSSSIEATMAEYTRWDGTHVTPQFPRLLEALSGHRHSVSFTGHFHLNQNMLVGKELGFDPPDGAKHLHCNLGAPSGSWYAGPLDERGFPVSMQRDGSPNGYAIVTFDGPHMQVRYKGAGKPADYQMLIHAPDVVEQRELSATEVVANVFMGSSGSVTRMRIRGHTDWIPMRQDYRDDPAYLELHDRTRAEAQVGSHARRRAAAGDPEYAELWRPVQAAKHAFYRRLPLPGSMATDHFWVANLPSALPLGVFSIEVETTDIFGQTFRESRPLRVVDHAQRVAELDRYTTRDPLRQ